MGRAERVAAARQRVLRHAREAEQRQEERKAARDLADRHSDIESLRVEALAALEAAGWPDGVLIKPYGSFVKRKKAGWHAGNIVTNMHGQEGIRPVYLLSNGKWSAPDDYEVSTLQLLQTRKTTGIEAGLRALIDKYT